VRKTEEPSAPLGEPEAPTIVDPLRIALAPTVPPPASLSEAPQSSGSRSGGFASGGRTGGGRMFTDAFDTLEVPAADPLIGVVVAERYRILERLGRGGMGIVYKVEHTRIGKLLAMKLLTGELSRNPEVVRRFKHEALTCSKLSNPNTVQVFDFGVSDGLTYLVMELVVGEDLSRTLKAGPLGFARLARIVVQACNALAEAHQKGIVHRDIKPENLMLIRAKDGTDIAKVLDFGLAKLREGAELNDLTSQGAIVGTPYFMSPEQIRGELVDARSDIYSLGGLMYRALTGYFPFNGPTPMAVFSKHLTEQLVPPEVRSPDLGIAPGVSAIVQRALAKDPAERFSRVEELQHALVEELRQSGGASVDMLLDSGALRELVQRGKVDSAAPGKAPGRVEIATRDEVEAYERKLRRQRYTALATFLLVLVGAAAGAAKLVFWSARAPLFSGNESEPNDTVSEADEVPLGAPVSAYLGKRAEPTKGDRDFFAYDIPRSGADSLVFVRLTTTALPNFPTCTFLYRQGLGTPLAQYCVGRPGKDLALPALKVEPGRYFVAVAQDMDPYGAATPPFVFENVSDAYVVTLEPTVPSPDEEVEPNDQVASANAVTPGASLRGALAFAHDEDVICVSASETRPVRFRVEDVVRAAGSVLEVTPMVNRQEGAPVRVHAVRTGAPTGTDALSPWTSDPVASEPEQTRCVRLRLVTDPWSTSANARPVPVGGNERFTVTVERP
jgi:tRNA A-37 threonylcarbamoyl transferase component Bud32